VLRTVTVQSAAPDTRSSTSEGDDGESDVRSLGCVQTRGTRVVCAQRGDDTKGTSSLDDSDLASEVSGGEEDEGDEEEEEHRGECDRCLVGADEHDEGEHKPGKQVDTEGVGELAGVSSVRVDNTSAGNEDACVGDPETTIRGEGGGTEGVAASKLPHASQELDETSYTDCHTDDDIRDGDVTGLDVVQGEDEGRRGEREEAQRSRVGELPVVDGETGLPSRESSREGLALSVASAVALSNLSFLVGDTRHVVELKMRG